MTTRGILFDNDGTLVDTHDLILESMRYATKTVLSTTLDDKQLMQGVGTPLDTQMLDFAQGDKALGAELSRVYRAYNEERHDAVIRLFDGVLDGLAALDAAGLRMGVVTAKKHALAQHGLEITGAWEHLSCLVGADDCLKSKPEPDPIIEGAKMLGVAPEECIYLGDSPYDMQAGIAAGCTTVAAFWGMFPPKSLEVFSPAATCSSFPEFTTWAMSL